MNINKTHGNKRPNTTPEDDAELTEFTRLPDFFLLFFVGLRLKTTGR